MSKLYTSYIYLMAGLVGLVGCNDPKTFVPTNTDSFVFYEQDFYQQASQLLQADYVIVPDMSYSMNASKDSLESALDQFADDLESKDIDYRVGFIRGTTQSAEFYTGAIPSSFLGPVLKPSSKKSARSQIASALADLADPNAPNWVFILEAAKKTLQKRASSFLRKSAHLVLVFISDSDERSHSQVNYSNAHYINAFKSLKNHEDYISARAFVTGQAGCPLFGEAQYGYKAGTRLSTVADAVDSFGDGTICLRDGDTMADSLEDLARDVAKKTKRFKLRATPVAKSIAVTVDGQFTPQNDGTHGWKYNSSQNEIVFTGQAIPNDASLEINYSMLMKLSREPRLESMVVTLNGSTVPESQSNGWSYNSKTKELRLNGGFAPSHNDEIVVNYEVQ